MAAGLTPREALRRSRATTFLYKALFALMAAFALRLRAAFSDEERSRRVCGCYFLPNAAREKQ